VKAEPQKFEVIDIQPSEDLTMFINRLSSKHSLEKLRALSVPESLMGTKKQFLCYNPARDVRLRIVGPGFLIESVYEKIFGNLKEELEKYVKKTKEEDSGFGF